MTTPYPFAWPTHIDRWKGTRQPGQFKTTLAGAMNNVETSLKRLRMSASGQGEARAEAKATAEKQNRATASGTLEMAGRPDIMADTPVRTTGFRPEANGKWVAAGVDHIFEDTCTTSIALEAPKEGKS